MEPSSSWMLVRFVSPELQRELLFFFSVEGSNLIPAPLLPGVPLSWREWGWGAVSLRGGDFLCLCMLAEVVLWSALGGEHLLMCPEEVVLVCPSRRVCISRQGGGGR